MPYARHAYGKEVRKLRTSVLNFLAVASFPFVGLSASFVLHVLTGFTIPLDLPMM
jgi:hypothetical protein